MHGIKDVALYLRKSRGEGTDDLWKHRAELMKLVDANSWRFKLYEEIASADSIDGRPMMVSLLNDVARGMYDAVLVIDYDRLGRGGQADQERIKSVFVNSETLIVTPAKVYDMRNDSDDLLTDVLGVVARIEYKQIKKRLARGKRLGAEGGMWTNGSPPFPYVYDRVNKKIVIDDNDRATFEFIKRRAKEGVAFSKIANELNEQGIRTRKGKTWSGVAIVRILTNEVLCGKVVFGKTQGSRSLKRNKIPYKENERKDWVIFNDAHEAVMTEEELGFFERISTRNIERRKVSSLKIGSYYLSGLVRCGHCGAMRAMNGKKNPDGSLRVVVKTCLTVDKETGERCRGKGINEKNIMPVLIQKIAEQRDLLNNVDCVHESEEVSRLRDEAVTIQDAINSQHLRITRIQEMYEMGDYTRDTYTKRISDCRSAIKDLEEQIESIRKQIKYYESYSPKKIINNIGVIMDVFNKAEPAVVNKALKQVVGCVELLYDDEKLEIMINFI